MRVERLRRRASRALRVLARIAGVLLITLTVLFGVARGGARYFYCPMMDATFASSCCQRANDELADQGPAVDAPECCKARRLGTLPSGATSTAPELGVAVFVSHVHPPFDLARRALDVSWNVRAAHPARDGPTHNGRRAELMIWNT